MVKDKHKPRVLSTDTGVPKLDRALYRNLYAQYANWSEAKQQARIEFESNLTSAQAWQRYKALWEFIANSRPPETELQAKQKAEDIQRYLERIRAFEKKRRQNSNHSRKPATARRRSSRKK